MSISRMVACGLALALVSGCGGREEQVASPLAVASAHRAALERGWPEPRAYGSMTYDPIHGKVLVMSGQDAAGAVVPSVWAFDVVARTWEKVADWAPPSIDLATFDVASGKVIVYFAFDWATFEATNQTWALDPETGEWEDRSPDSHPPEGLCGCGAQMVYDWRAQRSVMFGGVKVPQYLDCLSGLCDEAGWAAIETNDVWTYDYPANRWTKLPAPAAVPAPRNSHGLSYDLATGKVLLFGGDNCLESFGDTWAYDLRRNSWKNLDPAEAPSPRSYPKLTYDWLAGRTVAFGGEAVVPGVPLGNVTEQLLPAETWTYEARRNTWTLEAPEQSPSARAWNDVAYSLHGNRVVMFGGGASRERPTDETWLHETRKERWTPVAKPGQRYWDWEPAVNLGPAINTPFLESCVSISRDGRSMYFSSNRLTGNPASTDRELFLSTRADVAAPWGPPVHLAVFTSPTWDSCPALSLDEHRLYFASGRPGGCGAAGVEDLWVSYRQDRHDDLGWEAPMHLACAPAGPNSPERDLMPTFFEDEAGDTIMYFASTRPGTGKADLYQARAERDGSVGPATQLVELNGTDTDMSPAVRRDGLELFFGSIRAGGSGTAGAADFWTATRKSTAEPWSKPVFVPSLGVAPTGAAWMEGRIQLSPDGTELHFGSYRPGGFGSRDLFVAHREAVHDGHGGR